MDLTLEQRQQQAVSFRTTVRGFTTLAKPGITMFIGLTAGAGFILASGGVADFRFIHVLLSTMFLAAGAAGLNQVREADADARMRRTAKRPIPSGTVPRRQAAAFAVGLSVTGFIWAGFTLPWLTIGLLALAHASYVLVYTPMKRHTPMCTPVGAIPGALPILAGWTATGTGIGLVALSLAGVLYFWQIPHFLAIGWLYREDYERAGFRVLSVVDESGRATGRTAVSHTALLVPVSLVPLLVQGIGIGYGLVASAVGIAYALLALRFARDPLPGRARRLFFFSLAYLPSVLIALTVDRLLG